MKAISIFIIFVTLFTSCSEKNNENMLASSFASFKKLKSTQIHINKSIVLKDPFELFLLHDSIMVFNEYQGEYLLTAININTGNLLFSFARNGRGPDEFFPPIFCNYANHKLDIYEKIQFSFVEYNYIYPDSFSQRKKISNLPNEFGKVVKLSDSLYVGTGRFHENRLGLYDIKSKNLTTYCDYPKIQSLNKLTNKEKYMFFQGDIIVNSMQTKIVIGSFNTGLLEFYEIANHNKIVNFKNFYSINPDKIKIMNHSSSNVLDVKASRESPCGIADVQSTNNFVYALFSGKTYKGYYQKGGLGNIVLRFDWNGKPIDYFILDKYIRTFCISKNDSLIYAVSSASGEPKLITFRIK